MQEQNSSCLTQAEKVQKQEDESAGIFHSVSATKPLGPRVHIQIIITRGVVGDAGV